MDTTIILGLTGAMIMGIILGLVGGGGTILTLPVLVYIMHVAPVTATAYSLFIVGVASAIGAISYAKKHGINYQVALIFGIPAIIGVFLTRLFIVPAIPEDLFFWEQFDFLLKRDAMIMILFSIMMIIAAFTMIKQQKDDMPSKADGAPKLNFGLVLLQGIIVGFLTGLVGSGGGFMIVPALVLMSRLPMKVAIGTSMSIVAAKSLIGFVGDISNIVIDWPFLFLFTGVAVVGILLGSRMSNWLPSEKLKPIFGWFVLAMGLFIIGKEMI